MLDTIDIEARTLRTNLSDKAEASLSEKKKDDFLGPDSVKRLPKGEVIEVRFKVRLPEEATYLQVYDWAVNNVSERNSYDPHNALAGHKLEGSELLIYKTNIEDRDGRSHKDE